MNIKLYKQVSILSWISYLEFFFLAESILE